MGPAPSYYDSIGLLAICDAIDSVEGIPFHPVSDPKTFAAYSEKNSNNFSMGSLGRAPSAKDSRNAVPQHIMLAHIPVTGVYSPFGTISYEEQQRLAMNQLASTGQLPQQGPPHTIGGVRPNIPVAHNLHGTSGSRSRSTSMPQSPANVVRNASPSVSMSHTPVNPMQGPPVTAAKPMQQRPQMPPPAPSVPQHQLSRSESPGHPGTSLNSPILPPQAIPGITSAPPPSALDMNHGFGGPPPMSAGPLPTAVALDSRASTPGSPLETSQMQYRVEVCQICGRDFKGRKAATHKQQHIRRLHPAEYTPKRGGKKSRIE